MSYVEILFGRTAVSFWAHSIFGIIQLIFISGLWGIFRFLLTFLRQGPKRFFKRVSRAKPPENALDPEYGTHHMIKLKSSGISLHYVSKGVPCQPMLLFIHGFPECWYSWRYQMKHFSSEFRVVAIDLRGYGLSSKPLSIDDYKIDALTQDIADFIEQMGYEACDLIGHGTGGTIAWFTAMLFPYLVDRLVIINSPHPAALFNDLTLKQVRNSWRNYFNQLAWIPEYEFDANDYAKLDEILRNSPYGLVNRDQLTDKDLEVYKYTFSQPGTTKAALNFFRTFLFYSENEYINQLGSPVLLIWGCQNSFYDEHLADASAKYHDDIVIRKIPWASHWANQDAPDAVNIYIDMFFKDNNKYIADFDM